jgi:hypothetical protein
MTNAIDQFRSVVCECGYTVNANADVLRCPKCRQWVQLIDDSPLPVVSAPQPKSRWPFWAIALARYKQPTDAGVGDTAKRVFARLGGEGYKWLSAKLGMPCGCTERQAEWNKHYPYE